ncbi:MAG: septum formation initiator family protein [Acidimicrobiia bacterium]
MAEVVDMMAPEPLWRRPVMQITVVFLVGVTVLFLFVFPTRAYLAQRRETNAVREQLQVLEQQNASLAKEAKRLRSSAEIERIARDRYNLVKPGEKAYAIIPQEPAPAATPGATGSSAPDGGVGADANDAPSELTTAAPQATAATPAP